MLSSYWDSEQLDVRVLEVSGGEQLEDDENNQNSSKIIKNPSKTPLRIWTDFDLFQKIIVSGMRVSFFKKVQFFSFARSFLLSINVH